MANSVHFTMEKKRGGGVSAWGGGDPYLLGQSPRSRRGGVSAEVPPGPPHSLLRPGGGPWGNGRIV